MLAAMAAAILDGHVTQKGRGDNHVTSVTKEHLNLLQRERSTKDPFALIKEKREIEITLNNIKGQGH